MSVTWQLTDHDRETFERELQDFLPDRVFDAHSHLYRAPYWPDPPPAWVAVGPQDVDLQVYRDHMQWIMPGREVHALHMAYPGQGLKPEAFTEGNQWVADAVAQDPLARGHLMVRPDMDPEQVREQGRRLGMCGLKVYCAFAPCEDYYQAELPEYLPESHARVCHEEGWSVTLHLVRSRGIADASNQHWIRRYCETYPNLTLKLDHCARGFNCYHVLEGLPKVADLPNVCIDTSAVTTATAIQACLEIMGPERVMYGSDFYVSHIRGTNFPLGDTFLWLDETSPMATPAYAQVTLPLVGIENLRAMKAACRFMKLSDSQIEDVFWGNAARMFDLNA